METSNLSLDAMEAEQGLFPVSVAMRNMQLHPSSQGLHWEERLSTPRNAALEPQFGQLLGPGPTGEASFFGSPTFLHR